MVKAERRKLVLQQCRALPGRVGRLIVLRPLCPDQTLALSVEMQRMEEEKEEERRKAPEERVSVKRNPWATPGEPPMLEVSSNTLKD